MRSVSPAFDAGRPVRVIDTGIRGGRENVAFDQALIEALKVPVEKLARRDLDDARRRVITLREALGRVPPLDEIQAALLEGFREHLQFAPHWGEATEFEETLAQRLHDEQFGTDAWTHKHLLTEVAFHERGKPLVSYHDRSCSHNQEAT